MKTDPARKVATSGDGTVAMWAAARYDAATHLRTAWGKLFRLVAWGAAVPSFGMAFWSCVAWKMEKSPTEARVLGYFLTDYVAACGIGLTALFASISLPRILRRDVPILFGACVAGVLFLYLPSLLRAWPVLMGKKLPGTFVVSLAFPFALVALAIVAGLTGRRKARGGPQS